MKILLTVILLVILLLGLIFGIALIFGRGFVVDLSSALQKVSLDQNSKEKIIHKFAILSDQHSDDEYTQKAIGQAKSLGVEFLIDTGDWTKIGTLDELSSQKKIFDNSGLPYWGILGDHDRWQSGSTNFEKVFGRIYQSFNRDNIHFVLLDASDLENGFGEEQLTWLQTDLSKIQNTPILIFMHLPPYHPTSDRTIASKAGASGERENQVQQFLNIVKGRKVLAIFAGDHHLSETYTEPQTGVKIVIIGAVTRERNLQIPRFDLIEISDDFNISVKEEVIK